MRFATNSHRSQPAGGQQGDMQWAIHDVNARPKVLIMVSKLEHCLADLLFRWRMGELKMDIVGIVSNHPDFEPLAAQHGLPFRHFPITAETKAQQEAQWLDFFETSGAELVILARYMQVLSQETSAKLANRAINIHHSFLPGFKGAKPYHYACARREADRRDRALRHRRSRRRPDHRAGRRARRSCTAAGAAARGRA